MSDPTPETVFCFYRVIPGREKALLDLIWQHDLTLRKLALVTDAPMTVYRGSDEQGRPFVVKFFEWRSARAVDAAHQHPEVMVLWERMDQQCEARDGRPSMEFPHVERVTFPA
jgi:hypothetical protein